MTSTATDRLDGLSTSTAVKAPCKAVATSAITLSGEQTVGGVACVTGDRVLVTAQADASTNGIYVVDSSVWERATDFDGARDVRKGTLVALAGSAALYRVTSEDPIVIDTDDIDFAGFVPSASSNWTSIVDYGADASGAADSTAEIQATIDAVSAAGGGTVFVPPGVFKVTGDLDVPANIRVVGAGWGASVIRQSDASKDLFVPSGADTQFADFEMQGAATDATYNKFGVLTAWPRTRVERVKFSGASATYGLNNAVKFDDGADHSVFKGCYVERLRGSTSGRGYGVLTGACTNVDVLDSAFIGSSGRGRHGVYFSAGATLCSAINNHCEGFDFEAFTTYSQGAQDSCEDILFAFNTVVDCCAGVAGVSTGGISAFGHQTRAKILYNTVTGSAGCGIKVDGTAVTNLYDTEVVGNTVTEVDYIGIDIVAGVRGALRDNTVRESSQASAGTYANIRFVSDSTTGSTGWVVTGNLSSGASFARSALQLNGTAPVPTDITVKGNKFDTCVSTDVEILGTNSLAIDGRIRYSTTYDPGNLANGASETTTYTVTGAAAGDIVTVTHSSDTDGCILYGRVSATDTVKVVLGNLSGGAKDVATGTLYINVWKRTP